jgi:hypothetical protein
MAQKDNNQTGQKRGPGRPPGSKNKPKNNTAASAAPTKKEVIDEMQRRSDRDRRNLDVIWSITLFAVGLFLFFTVVMDSTGSFGMKVHDLCLGLFGIMAFVLPFLVFVFAALDKAGQFACKTSGKGNKTLGMLSEKLFVDSGLYIEAVHKGTADHIAEVAVTDLIFAKEN